MCVPFQKKNKFYFFRACCNIQTRIADDKFVLGERVESIWFIIAAIGRFSRIDSFFNSAMNSGSSVMLVW